MKIILQGYLLDANFGDMLSASLFYKRCQKAGFKEIDFPCIRDYGIGQLCRKQIGYYKKKSIISYLSADAFVIISGGSFWNDKSRPLDAKIRYRRFILPALIYILQRKPVYVLGVGGGPVDTPWLRKKMVKMLNKAKVVTFRDKESKKIFDEYGANNTYVTADTMLTIKQSMLDKLEEKQELEQAAQGRKKLLLHIPDGLTEVTYVSDIITPAIIKFLTTHNEYYVVLSHDNIRTIYKQEQDQINKIRKTLSEANIDFFDYKYHNCWQMCSLIDEMNCVITSKLHVGVVACALDKSVISFPVHREKTDNFYKMIDEYERCMNVKVLDIEKAYEQICRFHDKPVHISKELREKAETNLAIIDNIISAKKN